MTDYTIKEINYATSRSRVDFTTNGTGVWHATAFDGTEYSLVPWGSLRAVFASSEGKWNGISLGIVGSVAEANQVINAHKDSLPSAIDDWTGAKLAVA